MSDPRKPAPASSIFAGVPDGGEAAPPAQPAEELPQELQGKSPAEVFKLLQGEHQRVLGEIAKAQALDAQQRAAEATRQVQRQAPPAPPAMPPMPQEDVNLLTDPDRFMDLQFQKRVQPMVQTIVGSQRATNRDLMRMNVARGEDNDYDRYAEEIETFVNQLVPEMQVHPDTYKVAYNFVKSRHLPEILAEQGKKAEARARAEISKVLSERGVNATELLPEEAAPPPPPDPFGSLFQTRTGVRTAPQPPVVSRGNPPPNGNPARPLNQVERLIAAEFGMSDAEYRQYQAQNTDVLSTRAKE
jgi:hypothetical protein